MNILGFILLILLISPQYYGQDTPSASKGELTFYLDHASFSGTEEDNYVEFYLMFFEDQLTKQTESDIKIGEIKLHALITNKNGLLVAEREWITQINFADDESSTFGKVIYDLWSEELPSADYDIQVVAEDLYSKTKGTLQKSFKVKEMDAREWGSSDIEFLTSVEIKSEDNHFTKGNFKIIPNPSRRYGLVNPHLYFYYELYGIDSTKDEFVVNYEIFNKDLSVQKELKDVKIKNPGLSAVVIHGIDVSDLSSGIYELKALIEDQSHRSELIISRQFEIIQADFFQSRLTITEEQANVFNTLLSYLGTPQQIRLYRSLNLSSKAEFMIQYWKNLDPDPSTAENEYLIEIQKRFNHTKNYFGWLGRNGWETDRGRICIKYGIPHQVNQFNSEANTAPYEVWIYNENKTYEFIFGDPRSNGRFILIHSNREGEIYNSNWREEIQRM